MVAVPQLGSSAARARQAHAAQEALVARLTGQTGEAFDVETAFIVYCNLSGGIGVSDDINAITDVQRPPSRHDVIGMVHMASTVRNLMVDHGAIHAKTAFLVYRMSDGTVIMNSNLDTPVVPQRVARQHDVMSMSFVVLSDTLLGAAFANIPQATVQLMLSVQQQMAEQAEAAKTTRQAS